MNVVKDQLNRGVFSSCKDVNAIACLIKQWFRDMPQSIFVDIPAAVLLNMSAEPMEHEVQEALNHIREPNASLFAWLTDLLADVAAMESVNKMSPRACGTLNMLSVPHHNQLRLCLLVLSVACVPTHLALLLLRILLHALTTVHSNRHLAQSIRHGRAEPARRGDALSEDRHLREQSPRHEAQAAIRVSGHTPRSPDHPPAQGMYS